MASPEKKVKQKVRAILDSFGASHFMPATHGYGASGTADVVACYRGKFIAIECKATDKDKPTSLQRLYAQGVHNADGLVLLVHAGNTDNVRRVLEHVNAYTDWDNCAGYPGLLDAVG